MLGEWGVLQPEPAVGRDWWLNRLCASSSGVGGGSAMPDQKTKR